MADHRDGMHDRRILAELDNIEVDPELVGIGIQRDLNNIRHLTATIQGPISTPYERGIFKIDINLPETYPIAPPHMRFITKIWHPNISPQSGEIRMSTLKNGWTMTTGIKGALIDLLALLSEPDLSNPLKEFVTSHYRASQSSFINNAQYYTDTYARERDSPPETTRTSQTRLTRMPKRLDDFLL